VAPERHSVGDARQRELERRPAEEHGLGESLIEIRRRRVGDGAQPQSSEAPAEIRHRPRLQRQTERNDLFRLARAGVDREERADDGKGRKLDIQRLRGDDGVEPFAREIEHVGLGAELPDSGVEHAVGGLPVDPDPLRRHVRHLRHDEQRLVE